MKDMSGVAIVVLFLSVSTIAQILPQRYLLKPTPILINGFLKFGSAVAVSLDGSTIAVSAPRENGGSCCINGDAANQTMRDSGAVYVFSNRSGTLLQTHYVKASNVAASAAFGESLGISADGNTLVVGSNWESSCFQGIDSNPNSNQLQNASFGAPCVASGAVYVFGRSAAGTWSQQAYIKASNAGGSNRFGESVSLSGDGDTLIVGAPGENGNSAGVFNSTSGTSQPGGSSSISGAVYIFKRGGGVWTQTHYVKREPLLSYQWFGGDVKISLDGSTFCVTSRDKLVLGAMSSGAAYVYVRNGTSWSKEVKIDQAFRGLASLLIPSPPNYSDLASSCAISGDGSVLAIAAVQDTSSCGAVFLFKRINSLWTFQAILRASNPFAFNQFGFCIDVSPDGTRMAVGAPGEKSNVSGVNPSSQEQNWQTPNVGAVYLFFQSNGSWTQTDFVKALNMRATNKFGSSIGMSQDVLVVGAPEEGSRVSGVFNGTNQMQPQVQPVANQVFGYGAGYVFDIRCSGVTAGPAQVVCQGQTSTLAASGAGSWVVAPGTEGQVLASVSNINDSQAVLTADIVNLLPNSLTFVNLTWMSSCGANFSTSVSFVTGNTASFSQTRLETCDPSKSVALFSLINVPGVSSGVWTLSNLLPVSQLKNVDPSTGRGPAATVFTPNPVDTSNVGVPITVTFTADHVCKTTATMSFVIAPTCPTNLSSGAIAGIAVGATLAVVLGVMAAISLYRFWNRRVVQFRAKDVPLAQSDYYKF
jgi:hypothetical protein